MENEEQKQVEEAVEGVAEEVQAEAKPDRPERNYEAELARRKANEDRLRQELEMERSKQVKRYDPNDITTYSDLELKAIKNSPDPKLANYRDQAEELLLERKVNAIRERERMQEKRSNAEMALRKDFPEALDPSSEFAARMDEVIYQYDLQKSPAGRLAAAKIVAGEFQKGSGKANAASRKAEEARLKDVKQTLSEGDRPDPRPNMSNPKKIEDAEARIRQGDYKTVGDVLKDRGISAKDFFGKK